jgi:putative ATPase
MTFVKCPVCNHNVPEKLINSHLDLNCRKSRSTVQSSIDFFSNAKKSTISSPETSNTQNAQFTSSQSPRLEISEELSLKSPGSVKRKWVDNVPKPLAEMVRPSNFDELIGQSLFAMDAAMRQLIDGNSCLPSMVLWGPPGCGKTTIARIIGNKKSFFKQFSATDTPIQTVRSAINDAKRFTATSGEQAVIFLDEIHRFTKAQQDSLLPGIENGSFVLIGATTENPSFRLNNALLSRCRVFVLDKLTPEAVLDILRRGCKQTNFDVDENILRYLANVCNGDARIALNSLEILSTKKVVSMEEAKSIILRSHTLYDSKGDNHFNMISAFHKSVRGGDSNASLYWLGRMIRGGEDPLYIARRMIRIASEDIGLANNDALALSLSTYKACQILGMPESDAILAHCAVYLARSPKSVETYQGLLKLYNSLNNEADLPVPLHLRNARTEVCFIYSSWQIRWDMETATNTIRHISGQ